MALWALRARSSDYQKQRRKRSAAEWLFTVKSVDFTQRFEGVDDFVCIFTACGATADLHFRQHLGVSRWQSLALLHVSCVIVFVHDATTLRDGCVLPRIMLYGDIVYHNVLCYI